MEFPRLKFLSNSFKKLVWYIPYLIQKNPGSPNSLCQKTLKKLHTLQLSNKTWQQRRHKLLEHLEVSTGYSGTCDALLATLVVLGNWHSEATDPAVLDYGPSSYVALLERLLIGKPSWNTFDSHRCVAWSTEQGIVEAASKSACGTWSQGLVTRWDVVLSPKSRRWIISS